MNSRVFMSFLSLAFTSWTNYFMLTFLKRTGTSQAHFNTGLFYLLKLNVTLEKVCNNRVYLFRKSAYIKCS